MARFRFTLALALFSATLLLGTLPAWGDQSDEGITQLKAQMQHVIRRLERLEKGQKNCGCGRHDEADFQLLQAVREGPEGAAVVRTEWESIRQVAPKNLKGPGARVPRLDHPLNATLAERVTQLESTVKVLTEGTFSHCGLLDFCS